MFVFLVLSFPKNPTTVPEPFFFFQLFLEFQKDYFKTHVRLLSGITPSPFFQEFQNEFNQGIPH